MRNLFRTVKRAEMMTFKRWSGKSYSLFTVIKHEVRIGVLLAIYTTVALPEYVIAQTDSSKVNMEYNLEEIEVTAQRAPVSFSQVARIVSVIEKEEIEYSPVNSIQELLEYALSVDVRQRGVHGIQADVSIRGGTFDQTLILLNGVSISDPQTGHHALNLPVSLKNVHRIEILEGPAARVFGPNAFSGAINIITTPADDSNIKLDILTGQHKLSDLNLSGNFSSKNLKQYVAFTRGSSDGFINNTDYRTINAFYHGKINVNTGSLDFQFGKTNKAFGANSFYTATYPNQYEETKTTFASVKFESGNNIKVSPSVYWRRHQDRFELFRSEPASWYKGHNYHLTDVFGLNLNSWFASCFGKTAFGSEIRSENVWSNVLGKTITTPIDVPGESGQVFTKSYSRTTISYFAEHSVYLKKFTLSAGAMTNWISDLGFAWNIYPGIDASYSLSENIKIIGSASTSLRMPTFTDLFYNGPTNIGNPDLKPEESLNYESAFKFKFKGFNGSAGGFVRKGKNLIDWVREVESTKWQTKNLTNINSTGIEISTNIFPEKILGKDFVINKLGINYSYINLDKGENNFFSYYVLDNLKHKIDLELNHRVYRKIMASWRATYQDRNGMRTTTDEYEPFWLVNSKVYWKSKSYEIYGMVANLFDKSYFDLGTIEQPGRWISLGFNYQFSLK